MDDRLLAKWFLAGFALRLFFAIAMILSTALGGAEPLVFLVDLPTVVMLDLFSKWFPTAGVSWDGGHPFYPIFNLVGCVLWGLIFALIRVSISSLTSWRRRVA